MANLSVIIATYGRFDQLRKCLAALEACDFPREEFEVIVVDDGSPNPVEPQLSEFGCSLRLAVVRQANAGAAAARNAGANRASGSLLIFLDDDCLPEKMWLRAMHDRLTAYPDCLVGGRIVNAAHNNVYARVSHLLTYKVYERYETDPSSVRFFTSNNMAISKNKFLTETQGFNEQLRPAYEDREFCDGWLLRKDHFLRYAPEATVAHSRVMTLRSFLLQHIGYGRAAYSYHRASRYPRAGTAKPNLPRFFASVIIDAGRGYCGVYRIWAPMLVAASQMASLTGWTLAAFK